MQRRTQGNTARVYDADENTVSELDAAAHQALHQQLSAVEEQPIPDPIIARTNVQPSNRMFVWMVGGGLVMLIALLAAVLFNAGVNVQVLP